MIISLFYLNLIYLVCLQYVVILGLTEYFGFFNNLQLAHGADPTMKNQEGQTALDLATVKS